MCPVYESCKSVGNVLHTSMYMRVFMKPKCTIVYVWTSLRVWGHHSSFDRTQYCALTFGRTYTCMQSRRVHCDYGHSAADDVATNECE